MACKIKSGEWKALYVITGALDLLQFIIDFFPPLGELINAVADIVIGIILLVYFEIRGAQLFKHPSRVLSLLCIGGLEELTGGVAPGWIIDVWYIKGSVEKEQAEADAVQAEQETLAGADGPLYVNGVRRSDSTANRPLYSDGIGGIRSNDL